MIADIRAVWLAAFGEDIALARPLGPDQRRVLCPFHEERNPSCDVSTAKHTFFCRSCGASGGVLAIVTRAGYASSNADAVKWLRAHGVAVR